MQHRYANCCFGVFILCCEAVWDREERGLVLILTCHRSQHQHIVLHAPHCAIASHLHDACTADVFSYKIVAQKEWAHSHMVAWPSNPHSRKVKHPQVSYSRKWRKVWSLGRAIPPSRGVKHPKYVLQQVAGGLVAWPSTILHSHTQVTFHAGSFHAHASQLLQKVMVSSRKLGRPVPTHTRSLCRAILAHARSSTPSTCSRKWLGSLVS